MTLHDIIEKISMNSYTQYEIRVMLEEYLPIQRKLIEQAFQDGAEHYGGTMTLPLSRVYYDRKFSKDSPEPFVEDGLLAIPEEHIFDNLKEPNYPYVIEPFLRPILEPKKPELKHTSVFGSHGYSFRVTVTSECDREEIFKKCVGEMFSGELNKYVSFQHLHTPKQ